MKICKECEFFSENKKKQGWSTIRLDEHCTSCGCTLSAKSKCLSCECPLKKWLAIVTSEEEIKIKEEINGKALKN